MKKIISGFVLLLVFSLSGCIRFDGATTVNMYIDDEVYDSFEATIGHTITLDIPEKEGMMFTGWEYKDGIVYDELEVGSNTNLYATWEDPTEVFGFNEDPMIEYDGLYITSYSGNARHLKIPAMIDGEFLKGIVGETFKDLPIRTVFLPMDAMIGGTPFKGSEIERIEFYGEYQIPVYAIMPMGEFDQIIADYSNECIVESGGNDFSWTYAEGCPIREVVKKSVPVVVEGIEFFSYEVLVDKNLYSLGDRFQINMYSLNGASKLKTVEIPYGMESFFQSIFEECPELETVILDERNVTYQLVDGIIYNDDQTMIYYYPSGLKNETFELPETVTDVHMHAFLTTTYLKTLVIPESFDETLFFFGAESLEEIIVEDGNELYKTIDGVLYEGDELLKYPASKEDTSYTILEGTTVIRSCAFMDNFYLEELEIPSTVTEIQSNAFWKSESLKTLDIPSSVEVLFQGIVHDSNVDTIIVRRDWTIDGDITRLVHVLYGASDIERTIYVPDDSFTAYTSDDFWVNHIEDIKSILELN